ncbi:hypothetical protein [Nostoc sp. ChiQUE01b]|nr:hypothetical protein [Nostoc sp. ChiQUE01b]MDZ8261019.1 hypothetical protein [Nostoc sp. ChiQUE01b]
MVKPQYGSVKEIYPLRQAGGAGDAGEAGGEKKAYLNRIGLSLTNHFDVG